MSFWRWVSVKRTASLAGDTSSPLASPRPALGGAGEGALAFCALAKACSTERIFRLKAEASSTRAGDTGRSAALSLWIRHRRAVRLRLELSAPGRAPGVALSGGPPYDPAALPVADRALEMEHIVRLHGRDPRPSPWATESSRSCSPRGHETDHAASDSTSRPAEPPTPCSCTGGLRRGASRRSSREGILPV